MIGRRQVGVRDEHTRGPAGWTQAAGVVPPCPLCGSTSVFYSFMLDEKRFDECSECGLLRHRPSDGPTTESGVDEKDGAGMDGRAARRWFDLLARYDGARTRGRIGAVGTVSTAFVEEAERRGFTLAPLVDDRERHDVVVLFNVLEHADDPVELVKTLRGALVPGGVISIVSRRLAKRDAIGGGAAPVARQRFAFTPENLQAILYKTGFERVLLDRNVRRNQRPMNADDHDVAVATIKDEAGIPKLSVIVPVYNEAKTAKRVLDALVGKQLAGIDMEIIVIESNSTDGTRDVVLAYEGLPNVHVVLQPAPAGKGSAVREGIEQATGDMVLIQDADLEYDLLDYEVLVNPIVAGRTHFVLGTRHAGNWKIRKFARGFLANLLNLSHWALVALMNFLYTQSLTDPFTMFKVFRKDCLYGLTFECDLFDYDVELVCKLLRKGYRPLEVPVNYQARSFAEGKKIRIVRDGYNCVRAILKYRRSPLFTFPGAGSA